MNVYNNEEGQSLDKYESKSERYISIPFITPHTSPQKESYVLTDLGKGLKRLKYLICKPKSAHQIITNFALEFLS